MRALPTPDRTLQRAAGSLVAIAVIFSTIPQLTGQTIRGARTRGTVVKGEEHAVAVGPRGVAVSGEEGYGAVGRRGAVVHTDDGAAAVGRRGAVVVGEEGGAAVGRHGGVVVGNRYEDYEAWRAV